MAIKEKIRSKISRKRKLSAVLDHWTSSDGTPFVGINVHFCDDEKMRPARVTLDLVEAPRPHSAQKIAEQFKVIWEKWGLRPNQLFLVLTDGAPNVVKAFRTEMVELYASSHAQNCAEHLEFDEIYNFGPGDPNLDDTFDDSLSQQFEALEEVILSSVCLCSFK